MSKVSVSEEVIASIITVLQNARGGLEDAVVDLRHAYFQAGTDWNDKKYTQLGDIIERASRSILVIGSHLGNAKEKVKKLQQAIIEYINTGAAQSSSNANAYSRHDTSSRSIDDVIGDFKNDSWVISSEEVRKNSIKNLADSVTSDLQLTNPPSIKYYYREPGKSISYGFYRSEDNSININTYTLDDARETADTVAHELRHAWQRERAANPQTEQDRVFANNLRPGNYIRYEDDPLRYRNQPVERDARQYATSIVNRI